MTTWESTCIHEDLHTVLSVYVDDFKVARPACNMKQALPIIRGVISMDGPANLGKYLGCGDEEIDSVSNDIIKSPLGHVPLVSSQSMNVREAIPGAQQRRRRLPNTNGVATGGDPRDPMRNQRLHGTVRRKIP